MNPIHHEDSVRSEVDDEETILPDSPEGKAAIEEAMQLARTVVAKI